MKILAGNFTSASVDRSPCLMASGPPPSRSHPELAANRLLHTLPRILDHSAHILFRNAKMTDKDPLHAPEEATMTSAPPPPIADEDSDPDFDDLDGRPIPAVRGGWPLLNLHRCP